MDIQGYVFKFGSKIDAERVANGEIIKWAPKEKYYKDKRLLHRFGHGPFGTLEVGVVSSDIGVYAVVKNEQYVMFLGARKSV
jgi:hypothetical protein